MPEFYSKLDIDQIENSFFEAGNPLKKLLKVALVLFQADQVGILYGINQEKIRFLPTDNWDRGIFRLRIMFPSISRTTVSLS